MKLLSVVVPCYNEEKVLPFFYSKINEVSDKMENQIAFEYIFVDDGSKDDTLQYVKSIAAEDKRVGYVSFTRNFGKEAAIYAGLEHSKGDYVVLIDADLQNPPEIIMKMYNDILEGEYDSIAVRRVTRTGEPPIRSFFSRNFYHIFNKISDTNIAEGATDFRLMKRQMVDTILTMKENNRFTKGIFGWVGFKTKWLECENVKRAAGESKWSFISLFNYAIEAIVDFSMLPLAIAGILGAAFTVLSFISLIIQIVGFINSGYFKSALALLVSIIFFIGGLQFFCIGILSEYVGRAYLECKHRPLYIEKEESSYDNYKN